MTRRPVDWGDVAEQARVVRRLEKAGRMDPRLEFYSHPNQEAVAPIINPALPREKWDAQRIEITLSCIRSILERGGGVLAFCVMGGRDHTGHFIVDTHRNADPAAIPDLREAAALWIEKHKGD